MSNINIHNYEAYFLDYAEGNLTGTQIADLQAFLQTNPNLLPEFESMQDALTFVIEPEIVKYEKKQNLEAIPHLSMFDIIELEYLCIAATEGDTDIKQNERLQILLNRDENARILYEQIKQARVKPDTRIKFPKQRIKRMPELRIKPLMAYAAAASVMLFFGIRFFNSETATPVKMLTSKLTAANVKTVTYTPSRTFSEKLLSKNTYLSKSNRTDAADLENKLPENTNLETYIYESEPALPIVFENLALASTDLNKVEIAEHAHTKQNYTDALLGKLDELKNPGTLWAIAETGVSVFSIISDSDISMQNQYDTNGELKKLQVTGESFKIKRTFNNRNK